MNVYVCGDIHTCEGQALVVCLYPLLPYILRQIFSLNLLVTDLGLADKVLDVKAQNPVSQ